MAMMSGEVQPLFGDKQPFPFISEEIKPLFISEEIKPLFPQQGAAQSEVKLDLPRLGDIPFDPELAALCDRGGTLSDSPALFSWRPVRQIAEEICRRVANVNEERP